MIAISVTRGHDAKPRFTVTYHDGGSRPLRKTFMALGDAQRFRRALETGSETEVAAPPSPPEPTFAQYSATWLETRSLDRATFEAIESRLKLHVLPLIGDRPMSTIDVDSVHEVLGALSASPGAQRALTSRLTAIFDSAVAEQLMTSNPCSAVESVPPTMPTRRTVWELPQVMAMHDALPTRYAVSVVLASGLGLRQGEVFGLSDDDIDLVGRRVHVRRQVKVYRGSRVAFAPPRGHRGRTVPLPSSVADAVTAYLSLIPPRPVTLPWGDPDTATTRTISLVLTTRQGSALNRNYFSSRIWRPALARAGIEETRHNGMQALRDFYVSVLLASGEPVQSVSDNLGHSSPSYTYGMFSHLLPPRDRDARGAVDRAFGRQTTLHLPIQHPEPPQRDETT